MAHLTMTTLADLVWKILNHPLYSPDLTPINFRMFGLLKEHLEEQKFDAGDGILNCYVFLCPCHQCLNTGGKSMSTEGDSILRKSDNSVILAYINSIWQRLYSKLTLNFSKRVSVLAFP
jgi:hypothetical protein